MKIIILLSTYNGSQYLPELLASLEVQSNQNWKLLVRDDGSTDKTIQIIESFQLHYPNKIRLIRDHGANLGCSKSFMKLLEYADSEYIMFCDQDDVWLSDKIEKSLAKIQELEYYYDSDTPLLVFTDMKIADRDLNIIHDSFWHYQRLDSDITKDWKKLLAQNVITGCTIIMNQAAKKVSLPFALEEMLHDHWIGVNVAKYGKIDYIDAPTLLYRQHCANVEGAHSFTYLYIIQKIKNIKIPIKKLYQSASFFKEVSFIELLAYKLKINIERLLK